MSIDPRTLDSRDLPNDLFVVNYNGVLNSKTFATFQVSQKRFGFRNNGGGSSDIHDSPFFSVGETAPGGLHYNAPYFDETDPEDRNNRQVTGSVSYFLSSPSIGSHDLKGGVEWFRSTNTGGNSQTSTGYVFEADYLTDDGGAPLLDSQGPVHSGVRAGLLGCSSGCRRAARGSISIRRRSICTIASRRASTGRSTPACVTSACAARRRATSTR